MKKKFVDALHALIKDYGLSDKAIAELSEQGQAVIAEDATEEQVKSYANLFANIARAMQGEVTRKVQAVKQPTKKDEGGDDNAKATQSKQQTQPSAAASDALTKQLQAIQEQLSALQAANDKAAAERAEASRKAIVLSAAKKAGLSEKMAHYYDTSKIKTEAEADKFFSEIKQEMVNSNLRPKGADGRFVTNSEADKTDALAWANNLPNKK